jgi:hypothetical protein
MTCLCSLLLLTIQATAADSALEDEESEPDALGPVQVAPLAPPPSSVWYGGPAFLTDIGSTLLLLATARDSSTLAYAGLSVIALAPPIIHAIRHQPGRAVGSFVLRVAALSTSLWLYTRLDHGCGGEGGGGANCGMAASLMILLPLTVMIIDDAVIARRPAVVQPPPRVSLRPGLSTGPHGTFMALGGTF